MKKLNVIRLPGLNTDCLGNYLAALGVLAVTAKRWPQIRGCWIDGTFVLLSNEALSLASIQDHLTKDWEPTDYERWWTTAQKG